MLFFCLQRCMILKNFIKSKQIQLVVLLVGALSGFFYWKIIGCKTGTCPIKSVWYLTTLWGSVLGYLIGDIVNDLIQKNKRSKN